MSWSAPNKRKHCAMAWGRRQRRGCLTTQTSHGRSREGNGDGQLCFARWPLEEMMLRLKPFQQGLPGQATRHSGQMGSCRKFGSLEELQLTWNLRRAMTRSFRTQAWGGRRLRRTKSDAELKVAPAAWLLSASGKDTGCPFLLWRSHKGALH